MAEGRMYLLRQHAGCIGSFADARPTLRIPSSRTRSRAEPTPAACDSTGRAEQVSKMREREDNWSPIGQNDCFPPILLCSSTQCHQYAYFYRNRSGGAPRQQRVRLRECCWYHNGRYFVPEQQQVWKFGAT